MPLRVVGFLIFSAPPQGLFLEPLPKINKLQTSLVSDEAFLEGVWSRAAGKEGGKETKQSRGLQKTKLGRNTAGEFQLVHQLMGTLKTAHFVISVFHDSEELIPSTFSLFSLFLSFKESWPDTCL